MAIIFRVGKCVTKNLLLYLFHRFSRLCVGEEPKTPNKCALLFHQFALELRYAPCLCTWKKIRLTATPSNILGIMIEMYSRYLTPKF